MRNNKFITALSIAIMLVMALTAQAFNPAIYANKSKLASGKWVRIAIPENGVYELTNAELQAMGFSSPQNVRIFGYGGHIERVNHIDMPVAGLCIFLGKAVEDIPYTQTISAYFVCISRTDTFSCGADFSLAFRGFVGLVQQTMGRKDKMRLLGYIQTFVQIVT